jgi:hypothetical protein
MGRPRTSSAAGLTAIVLAVAGAGSAGAATVEWEGSAGLGHSDNITRALQDKQSATIGSLGMRFGLNETTRRVDADLSGDLEWLNYSGSSYSSEVTGNAAGHARVGLVEDRLFWNIEDSFGQTRRDQFSVPTPENREHINFFSTGPDLRLLLGDQTYLQLGGRYARVDYEHSPGDSQRFGGTLGLQRDLSAISQVSLNGSHQRIEPRGESFLPAYDRSSAYLRYAIAGARTSLAADVGGNRVKGGVFDSDGALIRLELSREVGAFSQVTARLGSELTDSGDQFGQLIAAASAAGLPATDASVQDAAPYTHRYVNLGWTSTGRITTAGVSAGWFGEDYEQIAARDREGYTLGLHGAREMGARTRLTASVQYHSYKYDAPGSVDNEELIYSLALAWRAGRRLSLELAGQRSEYSSDASSSDIGEMRAWLRLRYGDQRSIRSPFR